MPSSFLPKSRPGRVVAAGLVISAAIAGGVQFASADGADAFATATPIKHVVVLFQENTSFDHVFGTYPNAANLPGEIPFTKIPADYTVNGLTDTLLNANPNAGNPKRLAKSDVIPTIGCSNNHGYSAEQLAFNKGLMDKFVQNTQGGGCGASGVMNYHDGNTYTALWNYAQHYAMTDNQHGTGFGPSTIGAIELVSGNTATVQDETTGAPIASIAGAVDNGTAYSNLNPPVAYDGCSGGGTYALGSNPSSSDPANTSRNVGDLLNNKGVTWGWFQGGFTPTSRSAPDATFPVLGRPVCGSSHANVAGAVQGDYDGHHNPFSYYRSTANPEHRPPNGVVGQTDDANHNYDLTAFDGALAAGELPAVSFLKAGHYQDGHPGYSNPIDEQTFLVNTINKIQSSPQWDSTAIIIAWDDSDGWYDHAAPPIVRGSASAEDFYSANGQCQPLAGPAVPQKANRCGFGPRLPLLVISPYSKPNYIKHTQTDQTSVLRFIEDNWALGRIGGSSVDVDANTIDTMFDFTSGARNAKLVLDPSTGATPGTVPIPQPSGGGGGGTPAPAPSPSPAPSPGNPALPGADVGKLKCKAKVATTKKKVTLTCTTGKAATVKTAIRARLIKGKKTELATSSASLKTKSKKLTITLKTKAKVAKGSYTLTLTVSASGFQPTSQTIKVKL